jgi:CBS domain-containing protein
MSLIRLTQSQSGTTSVLGLATPDPPQSGVNRPALGSMTDFRVSTPLCVEPTRQIDTALREMIVGGVRALLVIEDEGLVGLVTATDILGERPIQFLQNPSCAHSPCRHCDITVGDVMTPNHALKMMALSDLLHYSIKDVFDTLNGLGLTHLLVVEGCSPGNEVRGILSRTQLTRDIGIAG